MSKTRPIASFSVDMKLVANTWIILLLLMLFSFPLTCSQCFKRFASMDIRKYGYETIIVDVNECVEKSQRVYTTIPLYPNDASRQWRNDASRPYFRWQHIGPCCCYPVSSSGIKKVIHTVLLTVLID